MPLLLPKSYLESLAREPQLNVGIRVGRRDLTGEEPSVGEVISLLSRHRRSDVVRHICHLLSHSRKLIFDARQQALAKEYLPQERYDAVCSNEYAKNNQRWCIIHRQPLWLLLQLSLLAGSEECPIDDVETRHRIGEACLIANDLLDEGTRLGDEADMETASEAYFLQSIPSEEERRLDFLVSSLARANDFWLAIPEREATRAGSPIRGFQAKVEEAFREKYGLTLREHVAVTYSTIAFFLQQLDGTPALLDVTQYYPTEHSRELVKKSLKLIAKTPDEFARSLIASPRQSWTRDFVPLVESPLVEILPNRFACPDFTMLCKSIVDGVYRAAVDAMAERGLDFKQAFGHVHEEYARSLLQEFLVSSPYLFRELVPKPRFSDNAECGDVLLQIGNVCFVAEIKGNQLTPRQKHSGSIAELNQAIDELLLRFEGKSRKGFAQLLHCIRRIESGASVSSQGVPVVFDSATLLVPLVIVFDDVLGLPYVRKRVQLRMDEELNARPLEARKLGPSIILSLKDLEYVCQIKSTHDPKSVLLDYVRAGQTTT